MHASPNSQPDPKTLAEQFELLDAAARAADQSHLFRFYDQLDPTEQELLLADVGQIDFDRISALIDPMVRNKPRLEVPTDLDSIAPLAAPTRELLETTYRGAWERGCDALRAGQVAAFTVAGGQGTRLGFDGPKGAFQISPIRKAPLFQLFAEYLRGVGRRYGSVPPWFVMTSPQNHAATVAYFEQHQHFGLDASEVHFFPQAQMPAFAPDGKILLADRHRVALSPDGHGGSLRALAASGALDQMRERGIELISYFQVDNPLIKPVDPLFLGLHLENESEMSSKAIPKATDTERVGNFCLSDRRAVVIEYSDLPESLATARNSDGTRKFNAGNVAIHVFRRAFVERVTADLNALQLPWHRADKKVPTIDDDGNRITPDAPNGVKLEMFVFDALPLAENPLVLYADRAEEFSPVKNATGTDSPETAQRDLQRRAARWLKCAGVDVPTDDEGTPRQPLEIDPSFALDEMDLAEQLTTPAAVKTDGPLLLSDSST